MLVCRACAKRTAANLLRRLPATENVLVRPPRTFATSSTRQFEWDDVQSEHVGAGGSSRDAVPQGRKDVSKEKNDQKLKWAVKKELQRTTDPFHIADRVSQMLKSQEFDKALMVTREASKDKQVVVSWNHLIEYQFNARSLHAGIKLYNEMKKRAQLPNAQTFTIIFKGCAESPHPKQAVNEALRIYNAMLASTRLKPNTVHLNAVLDVCARAQDLESMFVVLRSASGVRSPNNLTYTIILNALRYQRSNQPNPEEKGEDDDAVKKSIGTTIARAKMVWDEVMSRWQKGEITMDEELMCAMGRVLLLGGAKETDTVLAMVGEVLGITKLRDGQPGLINPDAKTLQRIESEERQRKPTDATAIEDLAASGNWDKPEQASEYSSSERREDPRAAQQQQQQEQQQQKYQQSPPAPPPKFQLQPQQQQQQISLPDTPNPILNMSGNNTLSLVMRALTNDKRTKLAGRYWDYLTLTVNIVPDRRNYRDYIDCLSTGAASGRAARALLSMPPDIQDGNLYRRGLLLCHFDAFNENAFGNAVLIFDAAMKKLRVPDARCMRVFLQVAVSNYRKFQDRSRFASEAASNEAYGRQILAGLDRVWEPLRRATNDLSFSDAATSSKSPQEALARTRMERQDIFEVATKFIGTTDKFLSEALIPKTDSNHKVAVVRRKIIDAYIKRNLDKTYEKEKRRMHGRDRMAAEA